HGRPALGGPLHAGVAQSAHRPDPHGTCAHAPALSPGFPSALGGALPPHPPGAWPLVPSTDGGNDRECGRGQAAPCGGCPEVGSHHRWRTAICGRVNQDGGRGRAGQRARRTLCTTRSAPGVGHTQDSARFAHGSARSVRLSETGGATGGGGGARVWLRGAPGGLACRGGGVAAGTGAARRRRIALPAWASTTGTVQVQTCADPRGCLSVVAAEHPATVPPADCPGVGGNVSRDV